MPRPPPSLSSDVASADGDPDPELAPPMPVSVADVVYDADGSAREAAGSPLLGAVAVAGASRRSESVESFKVMDVLRRANELQEMGRDVLHCEVGQPKSGAPSSVARAAVSALTGPPEDSVMGYTDAFGLPELRERIGAHYLDRYGGGGGGEDGEYIR